MKKRKNNRLNSVALFFVFLGYVNLYSEIKVLESTLLDEPPEPGAELIDKVSYILYGEDETVVLPQSDLERPTLDGKMLTEDEWVATWAAYLDAKRYQMKIDEDDISKILLGIQREHHISEEHIRAMFKNAGYTWEDARRQIGIMQLERNMLNWEVASKVPDKISDEEICHYCQEFPIYVDECYTLQRAIIPFDRTLDKDEQKNCISKKIRNGNLLGIQWSPEYVLEENELPDDAEFFISLAPGQISEPRESFNGFELIKLVNKKEAYCVSPEDRRIECEEVLKKQYLDRIIDDYYKRVIERTSIFKL